LKNQNIKIFIFLISVFVISSCKTGQDSSSSSSRNGESANLSGKQKMKFDKLFYEANREKMLGNYDTAMSDFGQALKVNPENAATNYEMANILSLEKKYDKALSYGKKAAELDEHNEWYQLLYADCLKHAKQPDEVAKVYEKLVRNFPDKVEFYYELANAYLYSNRVNEALSTFDKAEKNFGVSEENSFQKINIYKTLNKPDKALEEIQKLIKAFPKVAKYYGMLGELYQIKGMPDKAFEAYTDLLKVDPNNAFVHLSLADYYRNKHQDDKAFVEIKTAFGNRDLDIDTEIKILMSYYGITEKFPEIKKDAIDLCKMVTDAHPDEAKGYAMYGDFLFRDQKYDEARVQYTKAIKLDKEKYALWNQLLLIDWELKDYVRLEKESRDAIDLFPTQPSPYLLNGQANIELKNYLKAVDILNAGKDYVIDDKVSKAEFYGLIGDVYNSLKNYNESDAAYNRALEYNENNVTILNNYAYYLSIRKEHLEKAESMSKKTNDLKPNNNSYLDTYGWILYQMKKYDDAKVWIGKALENGGNSSGTELEHYGDVLFKLGDIDNAVKYWNDAKKAGGASKDIDKKIMEKKLYE
jgi:tetratricopeptide (TPR) repeat protein